LLHDDRGQPAPEVAIAVEPDARGNGLGLVLLEALASRAARHGHRLLSLNVSQRNPAVRLYRRAAFTVAREDAGRLVMHRRVAAA
jgi:GNAT superfamily N-acetyltransferase